MTQDWLKNLKVDETYIFTGRNRRSGYNIQKITIYTFRQTSKRNQQNLKLGNRGIKK